MSILRVRHDRFYITVTLLLHIVTVRATWAAPAIAPDYVTKVAPIFKKYCVSCHNGQDREGKLSLESFTDLEKGGEHGPAILPGQADSSRLLRLLTGTAEPKMPPEGNESPNADETALLRSWIEGGAKGPDGVEPDRRMLIVPKITPTVESKSITSLAYSVDGKQLAIGRFGRVEIREADSSVITRTFDSLPGKVNSLHYSQDGRMLVAASGVAGLFGYAVIWDAVTGEKIREFSGHRDAMIDAELSPDGSLLATCSYDRKVILWKVSNGEIAQSIEGHNDAVYDVAFHPQGQVLASAAGDKTVKLWHVQTGVRLDTLGQPQGEQFSVLFSPDGQFVLAGGADNRIRVWRLLSFDKPRINPLVYARFGHEGPVLRLAFSADGSRLISVAQDHSLKLWETKKFTEIKLLERQPDDVVAVAARPNSSVFSVGRLDGTLASYHSAQPASLTENLPKPDASAVATSVAVASSMSEISELEPNNTNQEANPIALPAKVRGIINALPGTQKKDIDLYRFSSKKGQEWLMEVAAARQKSPLDSRIEVLDIQERPIERVVLQAVRDSYFTFRGKDSDTSDDFRVHNWEEMELNDYLYADGEVVKLWLYPRGPDSGFKVYPGAGKRWTYFDTTPVTHAVFAPCYIVEPHAPGTTLIPNGLPVFPLYYENDDDSMRQLGSDSRLTFVAPVDGDFLVRVTDARGFDGEAFTYELTVRARQPDFRVKVAGENPVVNAGSGKEFSVSVERIDGFDGPVNIHIEGLPTGFHATSPLVIEAGQTTALGSINADATAAQPTAENSKISQLTASAVIAGQTVTREAMALGEIKLAEKPKLLITLHGSAEHSEAVVSDPNSPPTPDKPLELTIAPGETISAVVRIERNGLDGRVQLGNADSGRNMPHGVYVDNIGLSGLLIVEGQVERTFFITAAKWVPESSRTFHLRSEAEGNQTSWPVLLHVRAK